MSVTYSGSSNAYGTSADFNCETGYALLGPSSAVCDRLDDQSMYGFWNYDSGTDAPTCQRKQCASLASVVCAVSLVAVLL